MKTKKWIGTGLFLLFSLFSFAQAPGTIGPAQQTICYGTAPTILTFTSLPSGRAEPYSFRWERSNDGTNFKAIEGVTGLRQNFSPPILARSAWFRCRVTDANSVLVGVTNAVSITVLNDLIAGTIGTSQTINYGTAPEPLTQVMPPMGGSGSFSYRWQSSDDGLSWTDIHGATSEGYSPPRLFNTTRYRRWTHDLTCGSLTGNIVAITVNTNIHHYDFNYPDRESLLSDGWDFDARTATGDNRNTEQSSGAVVSFDQDAHPGVIRIPVDQGDIWESPNDSRNTLFLDLPSGWSSIRLKINSFEPNQDMQFAGMLAYQDDDNFVQIVKRLNYDSRILFLRENEGNGEILQVIPGLASGSIWMRMDYVVTMGTFFAYYSSDGINWRYAGSIEQTLDNPRLAILTGSSPGGYPNADIEWAEIRFETIAPPSESLSIQPGALVFNAIEGQSMSATRSLFISSTLGRQVSWSRTTDGSWLTTDIAGGQTEGEIKVSVNTSGLTVGTHNGSITLTSSEVNGEPVTVPVTLIINPIGVRAATWLDGASGAFSVSVDDGYISGSTELLQYSLAGTYVYIGDQPPYSYTALYDAGMELGCHTTNSLISEHPDISVFRSEEIVPNINGLTGLMPASDVISFVWPFGMTNVRLQAVVAEYFLGARGYNLNQLEDATPDNFLNLKSFNSIGDPNPPPTNDFSALVDEAIAQGKWFNLVLHGNTDVETVAAINHAAELNSVWTAPIGSVVKYIMQRERFMVTNYDAASNPNQITFNVTRLAIPPSSVRSFETAFKDSDVTTLDIDIDQDRIVSRVLIDDVIVDEFQRIDIASGNSIVRLNVRIEPAIDKNVRIEYYDPTLPRISLSNYALNFLSEGLESVPEQYIQLTTQNLPEESAWNVIVDNDLPAWLVVSPINGQDNGTLTVSIDDNGLANGTYTKHFSVIQQDAVNSPVIVTVNLTVNKPVLSVGTSSLNFIAELNGAAPQGIQVDIANIGSGGDISWSCSEEIPWLDVTPRNGTTPGEITVSIDQTGLGNGVHRGVITITAPLAINSSQEIAVSVRVHEGVLHYDFDYPDRTSLLDDGWDFIAITRNGEERNTEQTTGPGVVSFDQVTHPGVIRIPVDAGEVWEQENDSRNTLFLDLPEGWTSIRMKIESFEPNLDMQLAGMLAYQDDGNYVQINKRLNYDPHLVLIREINETGEILQVIREIPTHRSLWLRLDHNASTGVFDGYYSIDGTSWSFVGSTEQTLTNPRLAVYTGSSHGGYPNADIAWVEIYLAPPDSPSESLRVQPASLSFNAIEGEPMTDTQSLLIPTALGRTISWSRIVADSWINTEVGNGQMKEGELNIGVNTLGLSTGFYEGSITLSFTQVPGDPLTVPVTLTVNPSGDRATTWLDSMNGSFSYDVSDRNYLERADLGHRYFDTKEAITDTLFQNYPNPFSSASTISFYLVEDSHVSIEVFYHDGKKIDTVISQEMPSGYHSFDWNGSGYARGIYYVLMRTNNKSIVRTMLLAE